MVNGCATFVKVSGCEAFTAVRLINVSFFTANCVKLFSDIKADNDVPRGFQNINVIVCSCISHAVCGRVNLICLNQHSRRFSFSNAIIKIFAQRFTLLHRDIFINGGI